MRIAIINLTGGGISGGYREYLLNIIPRMAAHDKVASILCTAPYALNMQEWFHSIANVRFVGCKPVRFIGSGRDHGLFMELEAFDPEVVFVPVERSFRFKNVPVVNMIQNMEAFAGNIKGNPVSERVRQWVQSIDGKRALKQADRIIAPSGFVADFLKNRLHIPPGEIGLARYGVSFRNPGESKRPDPVSESWSGKFIFTAGSIRPARGIEDIIGALYHLSSRGAETENLVIAGNISGYGMNKYQKRLHELIRKYDLSERVCWTGRLNEKEMAWCYQNSQLFVMTSRVESFGMIAGEAMTSGSICISADNPCLPEIFGDAALYYEPGNPKVLAEAISTVLSWNDTQRNEARVRAKKQASRFSWDVCAEITVGQLAKAADARGQSQNYNAPTNQSSGMKI